MVENKEIICVACPLGCVVTAELAEGKVQKIRGFQCLQGKRYAQEEFQMPMRILPATVRVSKGILPLLPVKSSGPLPRDLLMEAMGELARVEVTAPVQEGNCILKNILNTGVDMVATRDLPRAEEEQG